MNQLTEDNIYDFEQIGVYVQNTTSLTVHVIRFTALSFMLPHLTCNMKPRGEQD
jgi:hypothetical protein